jgi:hypothetical protein
MDAFMVLAATVLLLKCVLLMVRSAVASRTGLKHPGSVRAFLAAAALGISIQLLCIAAMWTSSDAHPVLGNFALVLQAPGLLLCNVFGFGFHSEGKHLKLFYILMALVNAVTYSCGIFAALAFIESRNRTAPPYP